MILLTQFQRSWLIWNLKKKLYKPTVIFWNEKRRLIPPSIQIKPLDLSPRDHMKDWYKNDYSNHIHNCTAGRSLFMPSTKNSSRKNTEFNRCQIFRWYLPLFHRDQERQLLQRFIAWSIIVLLRVTHPDHNEISQPALARK